MFCLFYMVNSVEVSSRTAEVRGKSGKTLSNDYKLNLPAEKSENVHASPKPSVLQEDTPVSCRKTLQCPAGGHQQKYITTISTSITTTIRTVGDRRPGLFLSVMSKLGASRSMDIIDALASEKRQGELESIKIMTAFVMSRLQEFLPAM